MAKRTFTNELGREITAEVVLGVKVRGQTYEGPWVRMCLIGPDSMTENETTVMEAMVLRDLLNQELAPIEGT